MDNNLEYTIGIFSNEYLMLLELMGKLDMQLPTAKVNLFGDENLFKGLPEEITDQISKDLNGLLDSDVIVLLGKLPDAQGLLAKFDGTVVDVSNSITEDIYDDVVHVNDPLFTVLNKLALSNEDLSFTINFPMGVFGKDGIDTLMQETRAVYAFDEFNNDFLQDRIAFNIHFYNNLPNNVLAKELDSLRAISDVNIRLNPVSTVFIVDIFSSAELLYPNLEELEVGGIKDIEAGADYTLDIANTDHQLVRHQRGERLTTLLGDYLHMKSENIFNAVKVALSVS